MPGFEIRDRDGKGSLSIAYDGTDEWPVVLSGPGLTARHRAYAYRPHGGFARMFEEMAAAWRGWEGEKVWRSLESELSLVCTHDGLGHVTIMVRLQMDLGAEWSAEGTLVLEAGQLDALARAAAEFLDESPFGS